MSSSRSLGLLKSTLALLGVVYVLDLLSRTARSTWGTALTSDDERGNVHGVTRNKDLTYLRLPDRHEVDGNVDWDAIPCPGTVVDADRCDLNDSRWGVPTILLSFGRSGSTVTWDTMAALAVRRPDEEEDDNENENEKVDFQKSTEDLGKSVEQTVHFFDAIDPSEHGKCALERILCRRQNENAERLRQASDQKAAMARPGIYGTKWKPFLESFGHEKAREALRWLGANPHVKVLHNQRNLLDVFLSQYKHQVGDHVPAHCHKDHPECLQKHLEAERTLTVPTDLLLDRLEHWEHAWNQTVAMLDAYHVSTVRIQYETLYYGDDATEWNRILAYLLGPRAGPSLTRADVERHIDHVATSSNRHAEKIANYHEVVGALEGTHYARYLT